MQRLENLLNNDALRPFRFLIVGGAATATHLLIVALVFALHTSPSPYFANIIAFLGAFIVSFYGHRYVTFRTRGSMRRFLLVAIGGFLANNAILTLCLALSLKDLVSVAIATVCVPILTYLASSLWAFRIKED